MYSSSGFQAFGYNFDDNPSYTVERLIEFWKAQLAFRGFSPRGNNIEALKQRVRDAGENTMDEKIAEWCEEMLAATKAEAAGNRKRKAEQELENSRPAATARARAAAASASNAPIGRPAMLNFRGATKQARQAACHCQRCIPSRSSGRSTPTSTQTGPYRQSQAGAGQSRRISACMFL